MSAHGAGPAAGLSAASAGAGLATRLARGIGVTNLMPFAYRSAVGRPRGGVGGPQAPDSLAAGVSPYAEPALGAGRSVTG